MWFLLIPFLIAIILFMMYNDNHISMPVLLLLLIVLLIFTFHILKTHVFRTFNIDVKFRNDFGRAIGSKNIYQEQEVIDCEAE